MKKEEKYEEGNEMGKVNDEEKEIYKRRGRRMKLRGKKEKEMKKEEKLFSAPCHTSGSYYVLSTLLKQISRSFFGHIFTVLLQLSPLESRPAGRIKVC